MLKRILSALEKNETTLVEDSYFRTVLEENLLPLIEASGKTKAEAFDVVFDIIDELEPLKNEKETFESELKKIIDSLSSHLKTKES